MEQKALFELGSAPLVRLREKNEVQHFELVCKSILNYCDTYRMRDTFTINPYRGCEFGCTYCYARYTHEFMELEWEEFEKKIFVKADAPRVLMRTLDYKKIGDRHIAIGTATDPYQPAEVKFRLTQQLLQVFARTRGLSLSITTKSALIKRDIPLFQKISENNEFQINVSLISLDEVLLRKLEPKASRPSARLAALKEVTDAGVRAGINLMPIIPGISDSGENLEAVIRAAREHGAHYVNSNVLFLRDSSKEIFYRFLCQNFQELYQKYQHVFGKRSFTPARYQKDIYSLVSDLKKKYGFSVRGDG